MNRFLTYFLMVLMIIIDTGCPKPCIEKKYAFKVFSSMTPDLDSLNIGDTIFLLSKFPIRLTDLQTGEEIDYSGASNLGANLRVGKLESNNPVPVDAVADFEYHSFKGRIYNDNSIPAATGVQQLRYQEEAGNYELKIGLIPLKKGIYALGVGNGFSAGRTNSRNCEKALFDISLNNTDQHIYYFKNWRPDYVLSTSDSSRLYCFKVN